MTTPKPDLAAAARALNALVERMQAVVAECLDPGTKQHRYGLLIDGLLGLLDGPEQRAAQGALKAALAEVEPKPTPAACPECHRLSESCERCGWMKP